MVPIPDRGTQVVIISNIKPYPLLQRCCPDTLVKWKVSIDYYSDGISSNLGHSNNPKEARNVVFSKNERGVF